MTPMHDRESADTHLCIAGDHMARIAANHGLKAYQPVWLHAENRALREARKSPHSLAAGDAVFVPLMQQRVEHKPTDQRHSFRATLPELVLRLAFQAWDRTPIEEAPASVLLDGKAPQHTASGNRVELPIESTSNRALVERPNLQSLPVVAALIGHLQAPNVPAGFRARLNNLGYRAGDDDDTRALALRSAIEEFQCDEGLTVDGKYGPATQQKLVAVYGS